MTLRRAWLVAAAIAITGCATPSASRSADDAMQSARDAAARAERLAGRRQSMNAWLRCAGDAWRAMASDAPEATQLSTRCTDEVLARAFAQRAHGWKPGATRVEGNDLRVEFRGLSSDLQLPLTLARAVDIDLGSYGDRQLVRGYGVALAVMSARCKGTPRCDLNPPEGVFRPAAAWIEQNAEDEIPTLVITDPFRHPVLATPAGERTLSIDTSAPYALGAGTSKLNRLGVWGLLGGREIGRRAGVYLLDEYDPNKFPIVMIHGLGSSPLIWGRMSNAIWADPALRARYQIWHVVYQSDAPLLAVRLRVQRYLDTALRVLDPECDDPARRHIVLVGHSMGGVAARMLSVDSGEALWNAAFVVPPTQLHGDPELLATLDAIFHFRAYPGVGRDIFLATPHHGAPRAETFFSRFVRALVGNNTPEIRGLRKIAQENPDAMQPDLREIYQRGAINSISTLQRKQPVRAAGEMLLPGPGIPYHTIAGVLPGSQPPGDGAVPLESARIAGAASTLVIDSHHQIYDNPEAIAEVLRILHEDLAAPVEASLPGCVGG
ncbi:alpha/beta fold hydrolase [Noviluteimonas gilva]|uniref:alpha/beta fold hydrolase n=1 Tax=Noviluteimonas gilva TaxID=2682097 RepID=UPI0018D26C70